MLLTFYLAMHLNLFWENHRISITRDSILLSCLLLAKQHCSVEQFDPVSFFWGSTGDWDGSVHEKSINASHVTVPDISFKKTIPWKKTFGHPWRDSGKLPDDSGRGSIDLPTQYTLQRGNCWLQLRNTERTSLSRRHAFHRGCRVFGRVWHHWGGDITQAS